MQIFLPFADFEESCKALDTVRLGKQRVEAFQIWKAATSLAVTGWSNHVCTRMWRDYLPALRHYLIICCRVYGSRKTKKGAFCQNTKMLQHIEENCLTIREGEIVTLPPWIGNAQFHDSHKSMLYHKGKQNVVNGLFKENPYVQFESFAHITEYFWPIPLMGKTSTITSATPTSKKRKANNDVVTSSLQKRSKKKKLEQ